MTLFCIKTAKPLEHLFIFKGRNLTYGWGVWGGTADADQQTQAEQPLLLHHSQGVSPFKLSHILSSHAPFNNHHRRGEYGIIMEVWRRECAKQKRRNPPV